MGKSRNQRRRANGANYLLFAAETTLGWRVIRHVTGAQGEEMLARGLWRDVYDECNNHIGYQVIASFKSDEQLLSGASSTSITVRECELNAGAFFPKGRSHTAGLMEEKRISRHDRFGKPLPPEDAIERVQAKVALWPFPASRINAHGKPKYGDRAVRVYPKQANFQSARQA